MSDELDALTRDLLEWIDAAPRSRRQAMDVWGTHCPRLPVWETATDRHFVVRDHPPGGGTVVRLTPLGRKFLGRRGHRHASRAGKKAEPALARD